MTDTATSAGLLPPPVHAVLAGLVDYAGLFPPAGLGMAETVTSFATYQAGPDAWALARLVIPVGRLREFEAALESLPEPVRLGARFPISALLGPDPVADLAAVCTFNERHVHGGPRVESLEARVTAAEQVARLGALVPEGLDLFCELPLEADLARLAEQVRLAGAAAKVRTGGVTPGEIPAPEAVLGFLAACACEGIACKATAGLHHALRGDQALTYAHGSPRAVLFGYLNLVLAAAVLWQERPLEEAHRLLLATRDAPPVLTADGITWAGVTMGTAEVTQARVEFFRSIGSCSFIEPLAEAPRA